MDAYTSNYRTHGTSEALKKTRKYQSQQKKNVSDSI